MASSITPQEFVEDCRRSRLKESAGSQSHFNDLCRLVGHPTPAKADPDGEWFTFEKGAEKRTGKQGWADVWKKGFFAWEYKGKHKNLEKAYEQLLTYREALLNPPLLVVSDMETILIHTNFTNTVKREIRIGLDDLLTQEGLRTIADVFHHPERLRAEQTTEAVTQQAAAEFGKLAELLRADGHDPEKAAHFLIRILFCLFAEDIGMLQESLFTRLIENTKRDPDRFHEMLEQLFGHMATGGFFGLDKIPHFDGGLFDSSDALHLSREGLEILARVAQLDWSSIEPSIFGALFERSLNPDKRTQLGAHYTSREDILLIVEPVLMRPLRREWEKVKLEADALAEAWRNADSAGGAKTRARNRLQRLLHGFGDRIANTKVLDPACGSGNFLYVALRQLLDLEKQVITLGTTYGFSTYAPVTDPKSLYGIEINEYAHELAQATVWIGYIQWFCENGFSWPREPILKKLDNIRHMDAILAFDDDGNPVEPEWPEATVIIGNPPFLGSYRLRSELSDTYVENVFKLYEPRVPGSSDLCCYWFEKARAMIESGQSKRAGLLATQAIRGGANRTVLARIKESGDIFWAQSDREWILDGAAVHVSMIGFDNGAETQSILDSNAVKTINSDLTTSTDLTVRAHLAENESLGFKGASPAGPFDMTAERAIELLLTPGNPNGRPNSDVVVPLLGGADVGQGSAGKWSANFASMHLQQAAQYHAVFSHVVENAAPVRRKNRAAASARRWWQFDRPRPHMQRALESVEMFVATPRTAKHRLFTRVPSCILPNDGTVIFIRADEYFFGVLHSKVHELWARRQGTQLREAESGFRYTPTTCFETFPFPWPPGDESSEDPCVQAIAAAAKDLVEKRDRWLNPEEWAREEILEFPGTVGGRWDRFIDRQTIISKGTFSVGTVRYPQLVPRDDDCAKKLKKRTLTNLYNERPTWLDLAHQRLDQVVLDAYGWPHNLSDEQILEHLLALNLSRAAGQKDP